MDYRSALVRASRTFLQGCAATFLAFQLAVKGDGTFVNIKAHGSILAFGLFLSVCAFVVAFVQNLLESWRDNPIPRG